MTLQMVNRDLQIGDQKVTLNHLGEVLPIDFHLHFQMADVIRSQKAKMYPGPKTLKNPKTFKLTPPTSYVLL